MFLSKMKCNKMIVITCRYENIKTVKLKKTWVIGCKKISNEKNALIRL